MDRWSPRKINQVWAAFHEDMRDTKRQWQKPIALAEQEKNRTSVKFVEDLILKHFTGMKRGRTRQNKKALVWKGLKPTSRGETMCQSDSSCILKLALAHVEHWNERTMREHAELFGTVDARFYISANTAKDHLTQLSGKAKKLLKAKKRVKGPTGTYVVNPDFDKGYTDLVWKYLRLEKSEDRALANERRAAVLKKNKFGHPVNYIQAKRQVRRWIASDDWLDNFLGVMAAIGCRKTALIDPRIKFEEVGKDVNHDPKEWILQKGVLKDKTARTVERESGALDFESRPVHKPVLYEIPTQVILDKITLIRERALSKLGHCIEYKKDRRGRPITIGGEKQIIRVDRECLGNTTESRKMVARVKDAFAIKGRGGTHFLRMLYANVGWKFFGPQIASSQTAFIADVLAHTTGNLASALHYQGIVVQYGLPQGLKKTDKAQLIELNANLKNLDAKVTRESNHKIREFAKRLLRIEAMLNDKKTTGSIPPDELTDIRRQEGEPQKEAIARIKRQRGAGADHVMLTDANSGNLFKLNFPVKGKRKRKEQRIEAAREAIRGLKRAGITPIRARLKEMGFDGHSVAAPALRQENVAPPKYDRRKRRSARLR